MKRFTPALSGTILALAVMAGATYSHNAAAERRLRIVIGGRVRQRATGRCRSPERAALERVGR